MDRSRAAFKLGRAVLVASPNDGTPLATPTRWQDTVGWLANLLELFPDNPFTIGAEFVANGIVWLARHASGDLPGLHAMDGAGSLIGDLQAPPDRRLMRTPPWSRTTTRAAKCSSACLIRGSTSFSVRRMTWSCRRKADGALIMPEWRLFQVAESAATAPAGIYRQIR